MLLRVVLLPSKGVRDQHVLELARLLDAPPVILQLAAVQVLEGLDLFALLGCGMGSVWSGVVVRVGILFSGCKAPWLPATYQAYYHLPVPSSPQHPSLTLDLPVSTLEASVVVRTWWR